MSAKVEVAPGPDALSLRELCELGRRLAPEVLKDLGFLEAVERAEHNYFWRVTAAAELLEPLDGCRVSELSQQAEAAREQVVEPQRGSATVERISSISRGRRLPPVGSVITKHHRFQRWNAPSDGGPLSREFRFVVLDRRGRLVLLGDDQDVVYGSPSAAAKAATGNRAAKGWAFFGVN